MEKNTNKKLGIPKIVQFEVFKRDQFKCQYCGASAPEALLRVGFLEQAAKAGTDGLNNFVTVCFGCNIEKKDKLHSDDPLILTEKEQLGQLQERRGQLEMLMNWHDERRNLQEDRNYKVKEYWENLSVGCLLNENGMLAIKKWAKAYSFNEILNALDIAAEQYFVFEAGKVTIESCGLAFDKIPGIIKVIRDSKDNPDLKDILYVRGIIRNRLSCYDPHETLRCLKLARELGASVEELKSIACKTKDWLSFLHDMDGLMEKYGGPAESFSALRNWVFLSKKLK